MPPLCEAMQLRLHGFTWALAALGGLLCQATSAAQLRQASEPAVGTGDAAKAFAGKASARLRLLGDAARQVLATPGVKEEPLFGSTLHKVNAQLQESATILEKWGADYARHADANEMAVTLAEQGAAYEVQDLKKQLRAAIEADQEAQLAQPQRLADLTKKVEGLRSKLNTLAKEEAHQKSQKQGTALISDVWPRPPKNATKAEIGLFMHGRKVKVNKRDKDQEDAENLVKLESRLGSLETQLQDAQTSVASTHDDNVIAHRQTQAESK